MHRFAVGAIGGVLLACSGSAPPSTAAPSSVVEPPPSYTCAAPTGLSAPLAACTTSSPCTALLPSTGGRARIDSPSDTPTCTASDGRGGFRDGAPHTRVDADGVTRYACVYVPPAASAATPMPLVLFFHGAGGSADDGYEHTSIRRKASSYSLNDAGPPGFVLVSIQGRNLHWPTIDPRDGPHHDVYHRDLASPSSSPDIANADAFIDEAVRSGAVDRNRIYVMGWSNGGFFAELYAIARHDTATPGGNLVAAAAVYSAGDPFRSPRASDEGRCDTPAPRTSTPIALVSRACDIMACDAAQAAALGTPAHPMQPGAVVRPWANRAHDELGDANLTWRIVNAFGGETDACTIAPMCPFSAAFVDHIRWPDGIADDSGVDHEPFMLDFLRSHAR